MIIINKLIKIELELLKNLIEIRCNKNDGLSYTIIHQNLFKQYIFLYIFRVFLYTFLPIEMPLLRIPTIYEKRHPINGMSVESRTFNRDF